MVATINFVGKMNLNYYKYCWLSLFGLLITLNSAIAANASGNNNFQTRLNISLGNPIYVSQNERSKEYTFKAPDNKTLTNKGQLTAVPAYKVEVYGSETELLLKVRDIEPRAFVKGNIIQVGIFSQQNNAEDMVRKLARAGFWARIVAQ